MSLNAQMQSVIPGTGDTKGQDKNVLPQETHSPASNQKTDLHLKDKDGGLCGGPVIRCGFGVLVFPRGEKKAVWLTKQRGGSQKKAFQAKRRPCARA